MTWFLLLYKPKNCGTTSIRDFFCFFQTDVRLQIFCVGFVDFKEHCV